MTNLLNAPDKDAVLSMPAPQYAGITTGCGQVSLNQVLQQLFAKEQQRIESKKVLIRCDQLPAVFVDEAEMAKVCHALLQMILEHPPAKGKLFLYIKCNVLANDAVMDGTLPRGAHLFEIFFNTNTQHLPGWDGPYKTLLKDCKAILQQYGGTFHYKEDSESSYLFHMTLPGKLNEHATG